MNHLDDRLRKQRREKKLLDSENKLEPPISAPKAWIEHAYPLQQITVQIQGTRHSERQTVIDQLEEVLARLRQGEEVGEDYDDDFGYRFAVDSASSGPSFFDSPAGLK